MSLKDTRGRRRGSVLLEFALIALILFGLLAATFDFGRAVYASQVIEQAADHIAREIAVTPYPPVKPFALDDPAFSQIYSEDFLAIDITNQPANQSLLDYLDTLNPNGLPSGNKMLVPVMVPMDSTQNAQIPPGTKLLVFPGALVPSPTAKSGFTVLIPQVSYPTEGVEVVEMDQTKWLHVVEVDPNVFPLTSPQRGLASVRVNFPFQAAALSAKNAPPGGPTTPQGAYIAAPTGEDLQPGQVGGPYSGPLGLGQQAAFAKTVRPFRRVLSAQGVYRREIFSQ
jgi:hypothetical protein